MAACPTGALRLAGQTMTIAQIVDIVLQDSPFYLSSGGGVTLGGGEPSLQPDFSLELLSELKQQGIHTAMETCGHQDWEIFEKLAPCTDLFLYDLKHISSALHRKYTGVCNDKILNNLSKLLDLGAPLLVRLPLMKGINDQQAALAQVMHFLNQHRRPRSRLLGVEIIPYHGLGLGKYQQLGLQPPMSCLAQHSERELASLEQYLGGFNLPIKEKYRYALSACAGND
jgi:pyruvate formate lyase activating enzyme